MSIDRHIEDPDWLESDEPIPCDGSSFCQCVDCCADEALARFGREIP